MMVFLNNWDTFKKNNRVLHVKDSGEDRYTVTDVGATLGAVGGFGKHRSKNNVNDFFPTPTIANDPTASADRISTIQNIFREFSSR